MNIDDIIHNGWLVLFVYLHNLVSQFDIYTKHKFMLNAHYFYHSPKHIGLGVRSYNQT